MTFSATPAVRRKNNFRGQTTLEAVSGLLLVIPAVSLFLLTAFHLTGWLWTEYWAYQGLHCLFEKSAAPGRCRADLEGHLAFHPGRDTADIQHFSRQGDSAQLFWTYEINLGIRKWKIKKEWTLKEPRPSRRLP